MHARPMQVLITALYLPRRARRSGVGAPGHAVAHHSALLAQEGAPLWGRRSGAPVPLEVGQLLLILDFGKRLLLGRLGGRDRGLVLLGRAERL